MDLKGSIGELERKKENSLDSILESSPLKAIPDEKCGVKLEIPEYGEFLLTEWAHGQLTDRLRIPRRCVKLEKQSF